MLSDQTAITRPVIVLSRAQAGLNPRTRTMKAAILHTNSTCTPCLQLREDSEYYVPDYLSAEGGDRDRECNRAATKHAKHVIKAEGLLHDAQNLVAVLIASLEYEVDARAVQADATLRQTGKMLRKALVRIDKHSSCHRNLFLAYFALKHRVDDG